MNRKELLHDRHTVSLLMDHMVFAPKYWIIVDCSYSYTKTHIPYLF